MTRLYKVLPVLLVFPLPLQPNSLTMAAMAKKTVSREDVVFTINKAADNYIRSAIIPLPLSSGLGTGIGADAKKLIIAKQQEKYTATTKFQ